MPSTCLSSSSSDHCPEARTNQVPGQLFFLPDLKFHFQIVPQNLGCAQRSPLLLPEIPRAVGARIVNGTGAVTAPFPTPRPMPLGACKPGLPQMAFRAPQHQTRKGLTNSDLSAQVWHARAPHPQRPPRGSLAGALESKEGPGRETRAQQLWAVGPPRGIQSSGSSRGWEGAWGLDAPSLG